MCEYFLEKRGKCFTFMAADNVMWKIIQNISREQDFTFMHVVFCSVIQTGAQREYLFNTLTWMVRLKLNFRAKLF